MTHPPSRAAELGAGSGWGEMKLQDHFDCPN